MALPALQSAENAEFELRFLNKMKSILESACKTTRPVHGMTLALLAEPGAALPKLSVLVSCFSNFHTGSLEADFFYHVIENLLDEIVKHPQDFRRELGLNEFATGLSLQLAQEQQNMHAAAPTQGFSGLINLTTPAFLSVMLAIGQDSAFRDLLFKINGAGFFKYSPERDLGFFSHHVPGGAAQSARENSVSSSTFISTQNSKCTF